MHFLTSFRKKSESHINSFPHFTSIVTTPNTPIPTPSSPNKPATISTTQTVHFVALFSTNPSAIPVGLFHGWPGNFLEFLPILKLLKEKYPDSKDLPYHVIVPSLPGYAFSSPPPLDVDFDVGSVAAVMNQLMLDLGFGGGYVAQVGSPFLRFSYTCRLLESCPGSNCSEATGIFCYLSHAIMIPC